MKKKLKNLNPQSTPKEDINMEDLKKNMMISIVGMEHSLFSQVGYEHERIVRLRDTLTSLEEDLFRPENIEQLEPYQKMALYDRVSKNMNLSAKFMMDLHKGVTESLEVFSALRTLDTETSEKQREHKKVIPLGETPDVRKLLLKALEEKRKKQDVDN